MPSLTDLVPAAGWLRTYERGWLGKDVLGGLAAGAVVIPQAMAYATIADLPVQVGLYTCMVPMVAYALLGGSRALSVSTTSTVAVLTGSTLIAAGVASHGADPARDLATLTLLVGLILVGARLLRLGTLIDNISEATISGIKVGVGLTVAAGQLPKLLGIPGDPSASSFFPEVRAVLRQLDQVSWVTIAFATATLAVLLVAPRVVPRCPRRSSPWSAGSSPLPPARSTSTAWPLSTRSPPASRSRWPRPSSTSAGWHRGRSPSP